MGLNDLPSGSNRSPYDFTIGWKPGEPINPLYHCIRYHAGEWWDFNCASAPSIKNYVCQANATPIKSSLVVVSSFNYTYGIMYYFMCMVMFLFYIHLQMKSRVRPTFTQKDTYFINRSNKTDSTISTTNLFIQLM
jgi:hypothetical protein